MKSTFFFLMILSILTSCQQSKLGEDKLDLEDFNLSFNVSDFYEDEIEKYEIFESQKDEILNGKTKEEIGDQLVEFWDIKHIQIDTINYRNNEILDDPYRVIGIQYNMTSWSQNDSIAGFNQMSFHKIDMMKSVNGEFIALSTQSEDDSDAEFEELLTYLVKRHGNPEVSKHNFFGDYYNYSWLTNDRLILINSKYNNKKNLLKIGITINDNDVEFDTMKKPTIDTRLFIVNNKFKDSIMGRMSSGDWLYLK